MKTIRKPKTIMIGEYSIPRHNIAYAVAATKYPGPDDKGFPGVVVHLKHGQRRELFMEGWTIEGFNNLYDGDPF